MCWKNFWAKERWGPRILRSTKLVCACVHAHVCVSVRVCGGQRLGVFTLHLRFFSSICV